MVDTLLLRPSCVLEQLSCRYGSLRLKPRHSGATACCYGTLHFLYPASGLRIAMETKSNLRDVMWQPTQLFPVLTLHYNNPTFHFYSRKRIDDIEIISGTWLACGCLSVSVTDGGSSSFVRRFSMKVIYIYHRYAPSWIASTQNLGPCLIHLKPKRRLLYLTLKSLN